MDDHTRTRMLVIHICMGQETEWDLFRTFEAVVRKGSLTAAAKALGVSQSTVSRHLGRLEEDAGSPLLLRESPARLTERGAALLSAVEPMVDAALAARAALEDTLELRGEVIITTVGEVVRWVVTPNLPAFYRTYPHLRLRLLASNETSSLAAGDADIALRLARPAKGELVGRKVGRESFGFFAAHALPRGPDAPWLGLCGSLTRISEQRHAERAFASRPPRLLVEDVEALGLAVQAGLGVAVLPRRFAGRLLDVEEVRPRDVGAKDLGPVPGRDFWAIVHRSKHRMPKVRAVLGWLADIWS